MTWWTQTEIKTLFLIHSYHVPLSISSTALSMSMVSLKTAKFLRDWWRVMADARLVLPCLESPKRHKLNLGSSSLVAGAMVDKVLNKANWGW